MQPHKGNGVTVREPVVFEMGVTKQALEKLKVQRELLKEFVQSQLVEADFSNDGSGEGDYGVIPGTRKRCLFKAGAEKLQRLFVFGCRTKQTHKHVDLKANYAEFEYEAEIFHIPSGLTVSTCQGSANSQEVKYKERTVYKEVTVKGKKTRQSEKVETPVGDVLNTLMKMAQKRAMVGATIVATGASEYFTQDVLDEADLRGAQRNAVPPKEKASASAAQGAPAAEAAAPMCCGREMRLSNYADRETGVRPYWCGKCNRKEFPKSG